MLGPKKREDRAVARHKGDEHLKPRFQVVAEKPSLLVIGTWDPIVTAHRRLIKQLVSTAKLKNLTSTVALLHPPPAAHLQGLKNWPIYDDVEARVQMLRQLGVEAPIVIRFTKRDLDYGAAELFTLLEQHSRIAELWLGPSQSLGRGESGSAETIARLASKKRINLVRRPSENGLNRVGFARDAMQAGRIEVAAKLVGHPPMWKRPKGGKLFLSWPAGTYEIVPLKEPTSSSQVACSGAMVKVQLKPNRRGRNTAVWPVLSAEWIAFTRGPGDL